MSTNTSKKKGYYLPTILLGLIVAAIFLIAIFSYQVAETERALVLTMGKITAETGPGIHFRYPLPFQEILKYDIRKRTFGGNIGKLEETTTRDQKQVVIGINVIYRIKNLSQFKTAANLAVAEDYLGSRMRTAKAEVIGRYDYSQLINTNPALMKLDEMKVEIKNLIKNDVMERYGLEICDIMFSSIGVPENTANAIAQRMKQERETKATKYREEGKVKAAEIRTNADLKSREALTSAEAEAKRTMAQGDAEAAKSYQVFKTAPELASFLRRLQAMKKILGTKTTLILDTDSTPFDIFNFNYQNPVALPQAVKTPAPAAKASK